MTVWNAGQETAAAGGASATATGTIADDAERSVRVRPTAMNVPEGSSGSYTVVLGSEPAAAVTVAVTLPAGTDVTAAPAELRFAAAEWARPRTVTVAAAEDEDALADAPVELAHTVSGGDYAGEPAAAVRVTIVENDSATLAIADAGAGEDAGRLEFAVRLSLASSAVVTVDYASGAVGDTATAGADYTATRGTLTFPAGATERTITVGVSNDELDEADEETLTLTLSNAAQATLAGGGHTVTATGTIADDDALPELSIGNASVSEGAVDGSMRLAVTLARASARAVTVDYAAGAVDDTATAGADYTATRGTLRFAAGVTERTITVAVLADWVDEESETFTVTLSDAQYARLSAATATGTIEDDDERGVRVQPTVLTLDEGGAAKSYTVVLASEPTAAVTVAVTLPAGTDVTAAPAALTFTAADWTRPRAVTVAAAEDADALADAAVELAHTVSGGDYTGEPAAAVRVTIVENDSATLAIEDARAGEKAGRLELAVRLSLASSAVVTVDYGSGAVGDTATAGADYTAVAGTLTFAAGATERTIMISITNDELDEADEERFTVTLSNAQQAALAGGGTTAAATATIADDDAPPELSIGNASVSEGAVDGSMRLAVTMAPVSGRTVTVDYASGAVGDTATAGADYTAVEGTLTFAARTPEGTIAVAIADDAVDEDRESFTVTLSDMRHATLAAPSATGTIIDDDTRGVQVQPAALTLYTDSGAASYTVALTSRPTDEVTVRITKEPAAAAVAVTPAELRFTGSSWESAQTVTVSAEQDATVGASVQIRHAVSGGDYAGEPASPVLATIAEPPPLALSALQVTGAGTMYPEFDGNVHHYALTCEDSTTVQVAAQASRADARLTLLRAAPADNSESTGSLDAQVTVDGDDDIAIELSDDGESMTYVVHCLPSKFPDIRILKKTEQVADGLLFMLARIGGGNPTGYLTIVDNNGVPRFHREEIGRDFRPHAAGPLIDGKRVRYSYFQRSEATLLDADFEKIRTVSTVGDVSPADFHDFVMTEDGNFLFIAYEAAIRDFSDFTDPDGNPYPSNVAVEDSVIQGVSLDGTQTFIWNSWDHLQIDPDCRVARFVGEYAHLNSLQLVDGDIVASFRGCAQVVLIDRSEGTGDLVWKLGGTSPTRDPDTAYLEIVDDPAGEFCGQHHVTLTDSDTVVLFDNGNHCLGARKEQSVFSRVVEYDISSGTQAVFRREYRRPQGQGYSSAEGGVSVLNADDRWVITWGATRGNTAGLQKMIAISEVDPATGTAHFHLHMSKSGRSVHTYRVYREREADVPIPLNLP